ncbi:MAG: TetR/AcrR family transcriptional regulator [Myxococcales bacterium]|nr:TetR/AcrR family transcriptional regulator [Myxococcales bacterium]MCB9733308.1 TetR/AcrR family transcriptional regulator [Deltaproteobacteria bacterium]
MSSTEKPVARRTRARPARKAPAQRPGPVGGKRDRNRQERTRALIDAGLALFLERGIDSVTVDDIAKKAGTAKGNFYRYVEDKRDLVDAILAPVRDDVFAAMQACDRETDAAREVTALNAAYLKLAMRLLEAYRTHPDVVRLYLQEARAPGGDARAPLADFEQKLTEHTVALTTRAHEHGLLKKIPPMVSALAVIGAVERLLLAHLRDQAFDNEAEAVASLVRMVMEGIV